MRTAIALASLCLLVAACGDNLTPGGTGDDDGPDAAEIDAAPMDGRIDAMIDANCPARSPGVVGGPCTTDAQCDSASGAGDGLCLHAGLAGIGWPAAGYCVTKYDDCMMDSECGAGNVCVTITDPDGPFRACMPACGTGACSCANGEVCSNNLATSPMNKMACIPGNESAIDGDPCTGFGECDVNSICRTDTAEHPGGQCMQIGCTIGNDSTCTSGGDGHCANPGFVSSGAGCLDACATDNDCRTAEGYKCFNAGGTTGRYCRHPQAGDGCSTDSDCGNPAIWDCRTGLTFPGGMCTLTAACNPTTHAGCAPGSAVCYDPTGGDASDAFCINRCTSTIADCRTGYLCTPVLGSVSGCHL